MENTHEKIIAAARELFERNGFAAVTTKEIADLAGVSEVTLFRHFDTKRSLFNETVHCCLHPYKVEEYIENEATYELENDLKNIAKNVVDTFRQNAPMIRMIMRDKVRGSVPEMKLMQNEHCAQNKLMEYFITMKKMGRLGPEPEMAIKFFMTNITGVVFREIFSKEFFVGEEAYLSWMLDRVISILKP